MFHPTKRLTRQPSCSRRLRMNPQRTGRGSEIPDLTSALSLLELIKMLIYPFAQPFSHYLRRWRTSRPRSCTGSSHVGSVVNDVSVPRSLCALQFETRTDLNQGKDAPFAWLLTSSKSAGPKPAPMQTKLILLPIMSSSRAAFASLTLDALLTTMATLKGGFLKCQ